MERFVAERLGLQVGAAPTQLNQSFIYMMKLWLPEKAPALRYLQCAERSGRNCAAPLARSARVIVCQLPRRPTEMSVFQVGHSIAPTLPLPDSDRPRDFIVALLEDCSLISVLASVERLCYNLI